MIKSGKTAVPSSGSPVQLSATQPTPAFSVTITAGKNNQGNIYIGDSTVSAANQIGAYIVPQGSITLQVSDLSKVWLDAENSGDLVTFTYLS